MDNKGVKFEHQFYLTFNQTILFGVPANLSIGDHDITNEVASEVTAKVIDDVMFRTAKKFAGKEATEMQVEQYFRAELKREYQLSIPGGRVNFNSMNHTVRPTIFRHK